MTHISTRYHWLFCTLLFVVAVCSAAQAAEPATTTPVARKQTLPPLFASKPGHPWDELRDIFYVRHFPNGDVFADPHLFSPPWIEYTAFSHDPDFHAQVLARLVKVEKLPAEEMEKQPPPRRMIILRELWPMFDGLQVSHKLWSEPWKETETRTAALRRRDELLRHLVAVMKRLELTEEEVRALPVTLELAKKESNYPRVFDPKKPDEPFFPADLLDAESEWVAFSHDPKASAGASLHTDWNRYRSLFTLHMRVPEGRAATLKFMDEYTKPGGTKSVPPGTMLALLRRATVITTTGKVVATPVVESLHMIAVAPPQDQRVVFTLHRDKLLAGQHGLQLVGKDEHADATATESIILWGHPVERLEQPQAKGDGDTLIVGRVRTTKELPAALATTAQNAIATPPARTFSAASTAPSCPVLPPSIRSLNPTKLSPPLRQKESQENWKGYLKLREEPRTK